LGEKKRRTFQIVTPQQKKKKKREIGTLFPFPLRLWVGEKGGGGRAGQEKRLIGNSKKKKKGVLSSLSFDKREVLVQNELGEVRGGGRTTALLFPF